MAIELKKVTYKNIIKNIDCEFEEGKIYAGVPARMIGELETH